MNQEEYVKLAQRTSNTKVIDDKIINGAMGLVGESAEVLEHIKKWQYQKHPLETGKLIEEAGDVMWYLAELCSGIGITFEDLWEYNIKKLQKRYPDGFRKEDSINRVE